MHTPLNGRISGPVTHELSGRWPEEKAHAWFQKWGWQVGCNYIPSTAINQLEMWQEDTFDPDTIHRELGWAASCGFNTVRVFLHNLVWDQDPAGFLDRIDQFLAIASGHGLRTMLVLFDAVWDPFPLAGKQPEPRPFVHNSGWVQSPGFDILNNPSRYDDLRTYVQGVVGRFREDERVHIWDLYNEPDNMNNASYCDDDYDQHKAELSMLLLGKTIGWVRAMHPVQPITMAPWQNNWHCEKRITALDDYMFSESDIISFHNYETPAELEARIQSLQQRYNRPMLCTEYMARPLGSKFETVLPLLQKYGIGAYNWGLVEGKSQTHCAWDSWGKKKPSEPPVWFHDIFHTDGTPYREEEVQFLQQITEKVPQKLHAVA